jgi:endoglycosylceramidase
VIWSAAAVDATPPPPLVEDPSTVFAPHLYAESISLDGALGVKALTVEQGFQFADTVARQYKTTVWSGEWGWFGDPATDESKIARYARQEDAHLWGGAWWDWKQSCGDPHMFSDGDATQPGSVSPSLNRFRCPGNEPLGIPDSTRRILARPYVRFAPGRITSMESDPTKPSLRASGAGRSAGGSCRIEVWFPGAAAPLTTSSGVERMRTTQVDGGWIVSGCARSQWSLGFER